jgi:ABC-2 type transport system ATP-binding protein
MAREDDDPQVQDTTVIRGSDTHAWSAVDRPGTDPSDPRPQGPDTGGFADVHHGTGPQESDPAGGTSAGPQRMQEVGPVDPYEAFAPVPSGSQPALPGPGGPSNPPPPGPVLEARGLGLLGKSGWVFQNIDLSLRSTSVAAIVGPSGTGRSSLLLALSGRLRPTAGTLSVAGHSYRDKPSSIRQLTAIARVGSVTYQEPALTVREYIAERCLLEDVGLPEGRTRFAAACDALQLQLNPSTQVGTLFGDQATLFAVAAACVRVSAVIMLDDIDRGVSGATQQLILDALVRLAMTGPTIVVTTTDRIPVMEADVVLDLTPSEGAAMWQFDRNAPLPAPLPGPVIGELAPGAAAEPEQPPPDDAPTTVLPPQPDYSDGPPEDPDHPPADSSVERPDDPPTMFSDESRQDR